MTWVCIQRTRATTVTALPYIDELQTSINVANEVVTDTIFFNVVMPPKSSNAYLTLMMPLHVTTQGVPMLL
jgi:hypothetical protein